MLTRVMLTQCNAHSVMLTRVMLTRVMLTRVMLTRVMLTRVMLGWRLTVVSISRRGRHQSGGYLNWRLHMYSSVMLMYTCFSPIA